MLTEMFDGGRYLASKSKDKFHPTEIGIWEKWKIDTKGNISISISSTDWNKEKLCEESQQNTNTGDTISQDKNCTNKESGTDYTIPILISVIFSLAISLSVI